jgi:hypothetical protein
VKYLSHSVSYGTVVLPDADMITELQVRGQVFRTDTNDAACGISPSKIGPDNDRHAGGCDNIRLVIGARRPCRHRYFTGQIDRATVTRSRGRSVTIAPSS